MNFLLFFFVMNIVFSQTVSVKELILKAEISSPSILAEKLNIEASEGYLKQSKIYGNPLITYQGGSLKSGSQTGAVNDLTLTYPLPWPGKKSARVNHQEFLLSLSKLQKTEIDLALFHRIYKLSAELAAIQKLEEHYGERKRRFGLIEKSLLAKPLASPRQQVDRDLIESQMTILEKEMIQLMGRKESLKSELKILTKVSFEKVIFPWDELKRALKKEEILLELENAPVVKKWQIQSTIAENNVNLSKLETRPDIQVGLNYREERVFPVNHFYHGIVSVVIPIIDTGKHAVQSSKAQKQRVEALKNVEMDQSRILIHQYYANYEANKKALLLFPITKITEWEKKFFFAEKSFLKGHIDALTFLQIDAQVHENIDQFYLAQVNFVSTLSELYQLLGKKPEL